MIILNNIDQENVIHETNLTISQGYFIFNILCKSPYLIRKLESNSIPDAFNLCINLDEMLSPFEAMQLSSVQELQWMPTVHSP